MKNTNQIHRCKYGCGQEGTYEQKDGTYACGSHYSKCPVMQKKMRDIALNCYPENRQREQDLKDGKLKCYICGETANYLLSEYKPCCCDGATKCLGYKKYIYDIQVESYRHRKNHYYGKKRPGHSRKLVKMNELGTYGCYCYHHKVAAKIIRKNACEICGITNMLHLKVYGRSIENHKQSDDYSNYDDSNWMTLCRGCHMRLHKELRDKELKAA